MVWCGVGSLPLQAIKSLCNWGEESCHLFDLGVPSLGHLFTVAGRRRSAGVAGSRLTGACAPHLHPIQAGRDRIDEGLEVVLMERLGFALVLVV